MPLKSCPYCQQRIPTASKICRNCGKGQPEKKKGFVLSTEDFVLLSTKQLQLKSYQQLLIPQDQDGKPRSICRTIGTCSWCQMGITNAESRAEEGRNEKKLYHLGCHDAMIMGLKSPTRLQ